MARKPNWSFETCPTRHLWEGDTAVLVLRQKSSGRITYSGRGVNFSKLAISRGGLLEASILAAQCPLHASNGNSFVAAVEALSRDAMVRAVLGASPNTLHLSDVYYLFRAIDEYFSKKEIKSSAPQADVVRKILVDSRCSLANGMSINQTGYATTLQLPPRGNHQALSSKPDGRFTDPSLALPVSATGYANPKTQDAAIERHYQARLERIIEECLAVLNYHEHLAERIREIKRLALPDNLQLRTKKLLLTEGRCDWKTQKRRNSNERFQIAAYIVQCHDLHRYAPSNNLLLTGIHELAVLAPATSPKLLFAALLSDYYLSRNVIVACYVILLAETGWNGDTLLSLTLDRIRKTHRGFEITGLKGKTDQLQSTEIPEENTSNLSSTSLFIESAPAIRAIFLLITHNENIDKYAVRRHRSIFVSLNSKYSGQLEFDLIFRPRHLHAFCKIRSLPKFHIGELRNQVAQYNYIKSGRDLSVPQVILGHNCSHATEEYVNSSIDYLSNEANLKRYMDLLGASILFISGRLAISKKDQSPEAVLSQTLLWPPSQFTDESYKCRIDQWLDSGGRLQLKIGTDEAQHCAYQKKYYTENLTSLINANPKRFQKYELPRILICYALYKLIDASPLKGELRACEAALYA